MIRHNFLLSLCFLFLAHCACAQDSLSFTTLQYSVQLNYFGQNHLGSVGNMSQTSVGWNFAKLWTEKYSFGFLIGAHQRELLFPSTVNEDLASHALNLLVNGNKDVDQDFAKALQHKKVFGGAARYQIGLQFYKALPYLPQIELYIGQSIVRFDLTPDHQEIIEFKGWEKLKHPFAGASLKFYPFRKGMYSSDIPIFIGLNTEYSFPNETTFNGKSIESILPDMNLHWTKAWRIGAFVGIGIL